MNTLVCGVNSCVYNGKNLCCKNGIKVGGKNAITSSFTSCESFRRINGEFTSNIQTPNHCIDVICEAENCSFNNNHKCEADNISIEGAYALSDIQTECSTFISKIDK